MCSVKILYPDGSSRILDVKRGSLLSNIVDPGHLDMPCGGAGRCGKCRVYAKGELSVPKEAEAALLGDDLQKGIRLACLTEVLGDAHVRLADRCGVEAIRSDGIMPAFLPDPIFAVYGAAVDIGTTTLAASLYNREGHQIAGAAAPNPQRVYGADVISRIGKALEGEGEALSACVTDSINSLLSRMAEEAGIACAAIDTVVITGNTTMLYLLTKRDTTCLSRVPFLADELFGRFADPQELTLSAAPGARIYFPRCISSFVGADITTALLASRICGSGETALLTDIGTNGEIALWDGGKLSCCSTAAGPVFEGAEISCGMQGRAGAIDHVQLADEEVRCHVIGEGEACGICGSGIIDAVAVMCELEAVDETGYMEDEDFFLTDSVVLTQKDIRMVQLAKSAICAGMRTLLETSGTEISDVKQLAVAGGFGSFINSACAARIGLIPEELEEQVRILGNAALSGAAMILLNRIFMEQAEELAGKAETVDLSTSQVFMQYYVDCMEF